MKTRIRYLTKFNFTIAFTERQPLLFPKDVEAASSRAGTSAYEEALRRGIALVKDRKAASLLDAAKRAGGLSIFDLTEKLAREVKNLSQKVEVE